MVLNLRPARGEVDMTTTRGLFREYQRWLDVDL